jgi:putative IMPACT (imprinted ancient) family translation regulator
MGIVYGMDVVAADDSSIILQSGMALDAGGISVFEKYIEYEISCPYSDYNKIQSLLSVYNVIIDNTDFGSDIKIKYAVTEDKDEKLKLNITESFAARLIPTHIGDRFDTK